MSEFLTYLAALAVIAGAMASKLTSLATWVAILLSASVGFVRPKWWYIPVVVAICIQTGLVLYSFGRIASGAWSEPFFYIAQAVSVLALALLAFIGFYSGVFVKRMSLQS